MRITLVLICMFMCFGFSSQPNYVLPNEQLIFSFITAKGKMMVLAKDSANGYIKYRYGSSDKIEFEYPDSTENTWKKFTYSFYLRGGGQDNEGLDLNYVSFDVNKFRYVIYQTYSSEGNESKCGVKVIDTTTKKTTDIKGLNNTKLGTLSDFRDNNLLGITEEIFE